MKQKLSKCSKERKRQYRKEGEKERKKVKGEEKGRKT